MSVAELACTYAALILHDDNLEISEDNIKALLKAAKVDVETYWPMLFAKLFQTTDMNSLIGGVGLGGGGGGGGAAAAAPAAGGGDAGGAKEEKKEESEEESGSEGMMDLFG